MNDKPQDDEQQGRSQPDRGPRSVTRLLDLLLLLASKADGQTLADLSQTLAVPKSTLLGTLRGLCEGHYLEREDGRYRLGSRSFHLASQIVANWSAPDMVRQQVRTLARETRESVGFAIADWDSRLGYRSGHLYRGREQPAAGSLCHARRYSRPALCERCRSRVAGPCQPVQTR